VSTFGTKLCEPTHGSCRASFCALPAGASSGECSVPTGAYAEVCQTSGDCTTRTCQGGLCTHTCGVDADCGCSTGDLLCSQGKCLLKPMTHETEGAGFNDTTATAQPVSGALPLAIYGELRGHARTGGGTNVRDLDLFREQLTKDTVIDVTTRGVCGIGAPNLDTLVRLLDSTGAELASGDYSIDYAFFTAFQVPATGNYFLEVSDDAFGQPQTGAYVLEVKAH
jgi:hypothetical protein